MVGLLAAGHLRMGLFLLRSCEALNPSWGYYHTADQSEWKGESQRTLGVLGCGRLLEHVRRARVVAGDPVPRFVPPRMRRNFMMRSLFQIAKGDERWLEVPCARAARTIRLRAAGGFAHTLAALRARLRATPPGQRRAQPSSMA